MLRLRPPLVRGMSTTAKMAPTAPVVVIVGSTGTGKSKVRTEKTRDIPFSFPLLPH